jgi:hypothetical protein
MPGLAPSDPRHRGPAADLTAAYQPLGACAVRHAQRQWRHQRLRGGIAALPHVLLYQIRGGQARCASSHLDDDLPAVSEPDASDRRQESRLEQDLRYGRAELPLT